MSLEAMKQVLLNEIDLVLTDPETILSYGAKRALQYVEHQLQAIAEAEKAEPVAWINKDVLPLKHIIKAPIQVCRREPDEHYDVPLYTSPKVEQEPVAWTAMAFARLGMVRDKMHPDDVLTVQRFLDGNYTPSPQRQPLSDGQIEKCYETTGHYQTLRPQDRFAVFALARAIEAAHGIKEKNT